MKKLRIALAVLIFLGVGLTGLILRVSGAFQSPTYLEAWSPEYHKQFQDPRLRLAAHGLLAPSAHNMQSWKIMPSREDANTFTLFVDTNRLLPQTDPPSRQITISQGTFLELVNIAAAQAGLKADIKLFPSGEFDTAGSVESMQKLPVATITTAADETVQKSDLYPLIFQRVTARVPYLDEPLSPEQVKAFTDLNTNSWLELRIIQEPKQLGRLRELAMDGVATESYSQPHMKESEQVFRGNEYAKNKFRDGITLDSQGTSGAMLLFLQAGGTLFPPSELQQGEFWRKAARVRTTATPAYAIITSYTNTRMEQVETGRLYARLQLAGAKAGISMQPQSQVLQEYKEMSKLYKKVHEEFTSNNRTIQMLIRLGKAEKKVGHSPRRDLRDLIVRDTTP